MNKELIDLLKLIRFFAPCIEADERKAADFEYRTGYINCAVVKRAVITLRSRGCEWGEKNMGCTMCGHYAGMFRGKKPNPDNLKAQFDNCMKNIDFKSTPILCVYNEGNFLNTNEIPYEVQEYICSKVAENPYIRKFVVESRVEFCNIDLIKKLRKILGNKSFVIAVGLESKNDIVRNLAINKGISINQFERVFEEIKNIAEMRVYVMIKPPFLTESEMIDDAVQTIKYVSKLKPEEIHFEPITIQKHTLTYYLWRQGLYRLPWLWSIIEILKQIQPIHIYVSPFAHYPEPIAKPHNCPDCNEEVLASILNDYNNNFNIKKSLSLDCKCKSAWKAQLNFKDSRKIETRIADILQSTKEFIHLSQKYNVDLFTLQESHLSHPENFKRGF